jgi:creatinine amidohydrolase/Fe(II)-dependent formamide hydrolase-like protein
MDLGHLKGIYEGMRRTMKTYEVAIIEPWGPSFYHNDIQSKEPRQGFDTSREVHGCFRETSLMSYQYPYLVDPRYKDLPAVYANLYSPKALGRTFKELGAPDGYVGDPAKATQDYGRWYFQQIVETLAEATVDMVEGKPPRDLPRKTQLLMKSMVWL